MLALLAGYSSGQPNFILIMLLGAASFFYNRHSKGHQQSSDVKRRLFYNFDKIDQDANDYQCLSCQEESTCLGQK